MLMTLEKTTLDVKTGVKLAVRNDGVIEVAPDVGPVRRRGNGAAGPIMAEAPEEEAAAAAGKTSVGAAARATEARVRDMLAQKPDPFKWRTYAEIMSLVYPGVAHRDGDFPSHEYNILNLALKRLRLRRWVDVRKMERGDGLIGRRNLYRLHKEPADVAPMVNNIADDLDFLHPAHG